MTSPFHLSKEEMQSYGYKVVDFIVEHYTEIENKNPVSIATRKEMDSLFLQEAPDHGMPAEEVLDFVMDNVIPNSNISGHPKSFAAIARGCHAQTIVRAGATTLMQPTPDPFAVHIRREHIVSSLRLHRLAGKLHLALKHSPKVTAAFPIRSHRSR